jgi:hypothetical protein
MTDSSGKWPYSELAKLEVVALGCHRKLHGELTRLFDDKGIEAFQLVEYFLKKPVQRHDVLSGNEVCFPYLRRLFDENAFLSRRLNDSLGMVPRTRDSRNRVEIEKAGEVYRPRCYTMPSNQVIFGQGAFDNWSDEDRFREMLPQDWFQTYGLSEWEDYEDRITQLPTESRTILMVELDLVVRFWKACADGITTMVGGYPICSEDAFYGYFVIVWPEPLADSWDGEKPDWGDVKPKDVVECLARHATKYYVPTLALLHNSIWEDQFHKAAGEDGADVESLKETIEALPVSQWDTKAQDPIERGLARLWKNREELLGEDDGIERVKDTLLFRKYNIASPGMVEQVKQVMRRAPHFCRPEPGAKLPAALVYGEAGAGKDVMAKLIQLFTLSSRGLGEDEGGTADEPIGYFGLKPHTLNMSALKPDSIFGPLFQGMKIAGSALDFQSVLTQQRPEYARSDRDAVWKKAGVFILDELNSLDIDLQGVLLRILENGEVTPLFDITAVHVGHLIIGVVNEDPELLMREHETKSIKEIKAFAGEFVGNALYELFVKGRRLRPDLFYRLSRGLYIRLPPLRERREDIPILFYFECEDAAKRELKSAMQQREPSSSHPNAEQPQVYIELKAYDSLMDTSLDWPGNVRQLQAIALKVAEKAVEEYVNEGRKKRPGILYVRKRTVEEVLSQHFRGVFEERVDNKHDERRSYG